MGSRVGREELGALYVGTVVHKRARPKRHALRYRVFSMLVDLDRLEALSEQSRLFSFDRWNLVSLHASDFGPRDGTSVAAFIREKAAASGVTEIARIRMLAYPRLLGFAFNPITVYFCEDKAGKTCFIAYEVSNTFGEHHFYQSTVDGSDQPISHEATKSFYVSPFNTRDGTYRFSVRPPSEEVFLGITLTSENQSVLSAYFRGEHRPLTDAALLQVLLAYPFMTAKVVAGIYWEALLLWLKGVPTTLHHRRQP
jgi:DUF1365 family protein